MIASRGPHKVAVLWPQLTGVDATSALPLLAWVAMTDAVLRTPGLGAIAPDDYHVGAVDGRHVAIHALHSGDAPARWFTSERRDEVVWLAGAVDGVLRLHAVRADGQRESFDAIGRSFGAQLVQVMTAWLTARGLGPLGDGMIAAAPGAAWAAAAAALAPVLAELIATRGQWVTSEEGDPSAYDRDGAADEAAEDDDDDEDDDGDDDDDDDDLDSTDEDDARVAAAAAPAAPAAPLDAAALLATVPAPLHELTLRALTVVDDARAAAAFIACAPAHPWSLMRQYQATADRAPAFALVWQALALAPGWDLPYVALAEYDDDSDAADPYDPLAPTDLEVVAAAGVAGSLSPDDGGVAELWGQCLDEDGRVAEALRLAERAVALDPDDPDRHLALVRMHDGAERLGAWLAAAHRAGARHGCPMNPFLPWYPDQRMVDLEVATALMNVGRLDEAIALRANRLEGVEGSWPRHAGILAQWRKDPGFVAWCYAREGHARGDDGRVVEGFGRMEPDDGLDVAMLLDGLVATGREHLAPLAWAHFGRGKRLATPAAQLAAARALAAAGAWADALTELVTVQLTTPARDDHAAACHVARLLAAAPLAALEPVIAAHLDAGAPTIARRFAREIAEFVPGARASAIVARALGPITRAAAASADLPTPPAFAALVAAVEAAPDALGAADALVTRWVDAAFAAARADEPAALATALLACATHALARYLVAPPSLAAGALRTVAAEALQACTPHRAHLRDRDVENALAALAPAITTAEPTLADHWLAYAERRLGLDARWHGRGDRGGALADRLVGPEQLAALSWHLAALLRARPAAWAAQVAPIAARLAWLTGATGAAAWAEAAVALHATGALDRAAAIDALASAHFLIHGHDGTAAVALARMHLEDGHGALALACLCEGLGAGGDDWRAAQLEALRPLWKAAKVAVPIDFAKAAGAMFTALQQGDAVKAERLGRWCVALDPENEEAHRNLGLAFAMQGKVTDALAHLVRATPGQATQILAGTLYQGGRLPEALVVLDHASRWYTRADQWLTYAGVVYAAVDNPRTVLGYDRAWQLDPTAFDASQLNAYAGVLDEVGQFARCEVIARRLIEVAGKDKAWLTNGWNHLSCALLGLGRQAEAIELAGKAVKQNPSPDNRDGFAATLARAKANTPTVPTPAPPPDAARHPAFQLIDDSDLHAAAALLDDASWLARRAALRAARFRHGSDNRIAVTAGARGAAATMLVASDAASDKDAALVRALALEVRAQADLGAEPPPLLGDRLTRPAFYQEFRARGGVVLGDDGPPPPAFVDRDGVPGSAVPRASDYVALLRDLAARAPAQALAARGLDDASYRALAVAWATALDTDAALRAAVEAGLARP